MKRRLLVMMAVICLLIISLPVAALAAEETHEHIYSAQITEPTCYGRGYTTYVCACGDEYIDDYVRALGHDFTEPTCTQGEICLRCGEEGDEANGHDFEVLDYAEPTCTTPGYEIYGCVNCEDPSLTYREEYGTMSHDYEDWHCTMCGQPMGGDCGENLTWAAADGVLTVSGTGPMEDYTSAPAIWKKITDKITKVVIEDGVTAVGNNAFKGFSKLEKVELADSVTRIGSYAFAYSTLSEIDMSENLTEIDAYAFMMCPIKRFEIPAKLESIDITAFRGCTSLVEFQVAEEHNICCDVDGVLYSKDMKILVRVPAALEGSFTTPAETEVIGEEAFYQSKLTEICLSDSVTTVGSQAFGFCENLEKLTISKSVKAINDNEYSDWFSMCNKLTEIVLQDGVEKLCDRAFDGTAVTKLTIPKTVTYVGNYIGWTITNVRFMGDAPEYIAPEAMSGAVAQYPENNDTWTEEKIASYGCINTTWKTWSEKLDAPVAKVSGVSSSGKNKVSWNKVDGAVKYQVYRATSKNGTYKLVKTTTSTSYTNATAVAGTKYYYKVRAVDDFGVKSGYSSVVSRTCDLARPTVKVTNVSSSGKIKLTWNKVEGAKEYKVYRATSKTGTYKLMKTTTSTSYTNTSATAGKTYYYKVKAVHENSSANSAYSEIVSRRCDLPRPVVSIKLSKGDPKLSWSKISGAKEYKIYRATSKSGTYKLIKTTTSTSYTDTSAKAGRTYYYKVVAVHKTSSANSAYSLIDSIKAK